MPRLNNRFAPVPGLSLALPLAFFLTAACGTHIVGGDTDAGLGDAALADGGARDGGPDAGPIDDAGDIDAGDAGDIDAGDFDAGDFDAGDAGDAGDIDAGMPRGPARIELGTTTDLASAGAYVLIGKSGITNGTGSLISGGHLGVSPITSTAITGFGLVLDASNQFATSASVVPPARVYAADYAVPTPSNLTSAISSMEMGYTDGATRVSPDFLNLLSGNLGGLTLEPGLYNWGTTVIIPANVTLEGGAEDTWIFQVTGDVDLSASMRILLAGGAQARNIFWVVSGQVTMHAGSHFEGIILCQTGITLQTNATFHGRALAQSLVALDNNMITAP